MPFEPDAPQVDSFLLTKILNKNFQITISLHDRIVSKQIQKLCDSLKFKMKDILFGYVVPETIYDDFKSQFQNMTDKILCLNTSTNQKYYQTIHYDSIDQSVMKIPKDIFFI